jgi:hypothetical protein
MTTGAARTRAGTGSPSRYGAPWTVCGVAVWLAGNRQDQLPRSS